MRLLPAVLLAFVTSWAVSGQTYTISTFAGGGLPVNIPGTSASLHNLNAVTVDKAGNLFFPDPQEKVVLRLDATTGFLTLAAGNGIMGESGDNGPATNAQLTVSAVAVDSAGNLYIADATYCRIRKVSNGVITTVAGNGTAGFSGDNGPATSAQLYEPQGVAVDAAGNLYIADTNNYRIRKVSNGVITTVAGNGTAGFSGDNGPATSAELGFLSAGAIAVDAVGNLYIGDPARNRVREVSNGVITTVAGVGTRGESGDGGLATSASLDGPYGVAVDSVGELFIADGVAIRKVSNGVITTAARGLSNPIGVSVDSAGNLYVIAGVEGAYNNAIQKVSNGVITTVAGGGTYGADNGPATNAQLFGPAAVAVDSAGGVYFADGYAIRRVSNGVISTLAGIGSGGFYGDGGPATSAELDDPTGVAVDAAGILYIADSGNERIRKVSNGIITTVAGNGTEAFSGDNGPATSAGLGYQLSVAVDAAGNLYIADSNNNRVRKVSNGVITTVAGNGTVGFSGDNGPATSAQLNGPSGIAVDAAGNLYIADSLNSRIREVSNGVITTVAGPDFGPCGAGECFGGEWKGVAADSAGHLYVVVWGLLNFILKVSNGAATVIAGNGAYTFSGDNGPATSAGVSADNGGVAADASGNVYVADTFNARIRLLTPPPLIITGPSSIPAGAVGVAYSGVTFAANGGTGIYTWSATGLPNGLSLRPDGMFRGTPTLAGTYNPQFTVRDSRGNSASTSLSLTIYPVSSPVISSLSPSSAGAGGPPFTLTVNGTGFLSGATVQWNGSVLPTVFVSTTQVTASVVASLIESAGSAGIVVVNPGGASSSSEALSITLPTITQGGVVPVYSSVSVIQPGSWVSIYGTNLANGIFVWHGDFPTSLGGVSVTIDNKPAYLWYVSPTLINLQAPDDTATGPVNVVVTTGSVSKTSTVTLSQQGPSFLLQSDGKHVLAIVGTPGSPGNSGLGYDVVGPSRPVNAGETMLLFGVGFGPTTPPVPAGQVFSGPAAPTNSSVTVTIGGVQANVTFAGIIEAGLYQINLTVPTNTSPGDQLLQAAVNGAPVPSGPVVTVQ